MNKLLKLAGLWFVYMQSTVVMAAESNGQTYDLGIESMRSRGYSVGIFVFLVVSMVLFLGVLYVFGMHSKGAAMKKGEKVLFGMIIMGVFVAVLFAAAQLLDGFLF